MRVLRAGMTGDDVVKWQNFLRGRKKNSSVIVSGEFDAVTVAETKEFQRMNYLTADAIVGPATISAALRLGLNLLADDSIDENGPNWPLRPKEGPLKLSERVDVFGKFNYISAPMKNNPEAITITDGWAKDNIKWVTIPQLKNVIGAPANCSIQVHKKIACQLQATFAEWESSCLIDRVKNWGGMWVPRFIRGSRTTLSNHAWGTAFDINVPWNMLGTVPALKGETGSVRELVEIAYKNGFYWGGWFPNRLDGMHFEAYKII